MGQEYTSVSNRISTREARRPAETLRQIQVYTQALGFRLLYREVMANKTIRGWEDYECS